MPCLIVASPFLTVTCRAIPDLELELGTSIVAFITDGAKNMENMRTLVTTRCVAGALVRCYCASIRRRNVLSYWCQSHLLNLVTCDFFKHQGRQQVLDTVTKVHKV